MSYDDNAPAAPAAPADAVASVPAPFADASSPFTLDRINDIIDFESELIMLDRANRKDHYETLKFFWQLHPARNVKTGRRYARFLIAQLLSTACNCEPYSSNSKSSSHKKMPAAVTEVNGQQQPLDQWKRQDWQRLQDDLQHLREVLIRQDAERNCDDVTMDQQKQSQQDEGDAQEDEATAIAAAIATATRLNVKRAQSAAFSTKYDTISILLETQKALAPIRCRLEQLLKPKASQVEEMSTIESVISPEEMQDLFGYAASLTETRVSDLLLQLFEPGAHADTAATAAFGASTTDDSAEQQRQPVLQSNRQELKDLMTTKAFDLAYFQEKLQTVLLRFNGEVYGKQVPYLLKLHYTLAPAPSGRSVDRRAKRVSQELNKFIMETEQKPRVRFTAIRSSTIKKKPPPAPASSAKKSKKKKTDLKKGGQAEKHEPGRTAPGDFLVFGTPASTTATTPEDDSKKGDSSSKKRSLPELDILDLFDLDDKDDANEAAKMSQGVKKSRVVANSGSASRGRGAYNSSSAAASVGISAAADDPNYHWDLPPPDDGIFDETGKVLRRIKWTGEEKNAIKEGVRAIGVGKWMDVKKKYPFILKNRTSVQIKDCYRTMSKNKEIEIEGV